MGKKIISGGVWSMRCKEILEKKTIEAVDSLGCAAKFKLIILDLAAQQV